MACDVQELISTNPCLSTLNDYSLEVLRTAQLCALYNNLNDGTPLTCDIQELLSESSCFYGLSEHDLKVLQASLLCQIFELL